MTTTTLIILIFCIGVPIIIVSVVLIRKVQEESNFFTAASFASIFLFSFFYSLFNKKLFGSSGKSICLLCFN